LDTAASGEIPARGVCFGIHIGELILRLTGPWQGNSGFRLRLSGGLATWEKVSGLWRLDDASLLIQPVKEAAFFRATLDPE
jgi:hypothetical protein